MTPSYLADKSALARGDDATVADRFEPLMEGGEIATCTMVELEVLFSVRSPHEYETVRHEVMGALPRVPIGQSTLDRAVDVQALLAKRSAHRGASIPDLIVAAAAESAGLTVLHYDADFDLIADATGQPVEWVVPQGSID